MNDSWLLQVLVIMCKAAINICITHFSVDMGFQLLGVKYQTLPKWLCHFCIPTSSEQEFCCSTSSSALGVVSVLDLGHSNRSSYFNLCFPHNQWCQTSFHMLSCNLYIFFGEVYFKVFDPFLNWVVFLLLSFKSSLYILDNSLLSDAFFGKYFPPVYPDPVFSQSRCFYFKWSSSYHLSLSYVVPLMMYLSGYYYIQLYLDFLLCYLLGTLQFCIFHLNLRSILT